MENNIEQQIQKRVAELPEDIQRAIASANLDKQIQDIGKKYNLHVDQMEKLEEETLLVMLGFSDPLEFPNHLVERLTVPNEQAGKLAEDVTKEVFMPIRESMKKFMEERAQQVQAEEAAALVRSTEAKPLKPPELHVADKMLSEKTVSTQKTAPVAPKPTPYKTDPYRELPE